MSLVEPSTIHHGHHDGDGTVPSGVLFKDIAPLRRAPKTHDNRDGL